MNKTAIATGTVAILAAVGLTGCSSSSPGGDNGQPGGQVTITYSNFISNGGNEDNLQKIVAAFEKENPTIKVKVTTSDYANYFTKLQTDLAAGTQADVFDVDTGSFANIQADGVLASVSGFDAAKYRTSLLDTYKVDGKQYGLPTSFSNVVLFYNKDLFDKAGVAYPTADWTWADEKAAAEKLTDKKAGVWGDYQPITYNEYYKVVQQAGGDFLSDDHSSAAFGSTEGERAADWLAGKSGTVMPTAANGAGTPDFDSNLFKEGKLAMWHTGIWMFGLLGDLPFDWDVAVEPGDTQKASATFSNAVVVSSSAKDKEAAEKWAEYLSSSDEMVKVRIDAGWELPPVSDQTLLKPYLEKTPPTNRQAVFDSLEHVAVQPQLGPSSQKIQDAVTNALGEIAAGRTTTEKAVPTLAKQVDALLK